MLSDAQWPRETWDDDIRLMKKAEVNVPATDALAGGAVRVVRLDSSEDDQTST